MSGHFENCLKDLKALPELEPPEQLEKATLAAMAEAAAQKAGGGSGRWLAQAAAWLVAIGIGALVVTRFIDVEQPVSPDTEAGVADAAYLELVEESMRLEEVLALLPPPRRVMRADTASTIVGLEDRIALIDAALYQPEIRAAAPQYREALMRDRVEVMNALVNVRYAQSQAFIY
jgi:hypothetical protein